MQDNAVQYTSGTVPTILAANTISNTGNIAKMVYPDFLVEMVIGILTTQTKEINNCKLYSLMKKLAIRTANHPLHPLPYPQGIIITSIVYWQPL